MHFLVSPYRPDGVWVWQPLAVECCPDNQRGPPQAKFVGGCHASKFHSSQTAVEDGGDLLIEASRYHQGADGTLLGCQLLHVGRAFGTHAAPFPAPLQIALRTGLLSNHVTRLRLDDPY